jgi:GT2 family glycosyltransferase
LCRNRIIPCSNLECSARECSTTARIAISPTPAATHPASIVVPTRARPRYLEVALASIAPQALAAGVDVLVVDDAGASPAIHALAGRFGARYEPHPRPLGLNVARNTGVAHSDGELVVFVDDDVEVRPGWLDALLGAAREHPRVPVFTGPIRPRLEGRGGWARHSCGREGPPITALDLGPEDTDRVRYAWGANMAIRRDALARVGPFDVTLEHAGDEQEWQDRLAAACSGARVLYVAAAALDHRRCGPDARLPALARAARARGRAARRFDAWRGESGRPPEAGGLGPDGLPSLARELRTLAGCAAHVVRRRCPAGLTLVAHSCGRLEQALSERLGRTDSNAGPAAAVDDFLSGESGTVGGLDAVRRELRDRLTDAGELLGTRRARLDRAARRRPPRRRVLVLGVARPEHRALSAAIRAELERSRHDVELRFAPPGDAGKFENLNRLLATHAPASHDPQNGPRPAGGADLERTPDPLPDHDWLLVVDDDVVLPRGFLDRLLFLAERFDFDLVQPAHRARSHAAWRVTRRTAGTLARETQFVEIGPVTAFARSTFSTLLPFPGALRMGWGLDLHWAALARERGWRCGVLDAVAIAHSAAPAADAYSREAAVAEARAFLAERPYLNAGEAQQTLVAHRRL